jgi:putative membrane protein
MRCSQVARFAIANPPKNRGAGGKPASVVAKKRTLFSSFICTMLLKTVFATTMQAGRKKFLRFLGNWAINTLAVAVAAIILHKHIHCEKPVYLIFAALLLGILNAFVKPILMFLALPLLVFTLGLFTLVINMLLLYFVGVLMKPYFEVDSYGAAFLGALIISVVSVALNVLTGNARVSVQRRRRPPKGPGDGPTIDV